MNSFLITKLILNGVFFSIKLFQSSSLEIKARGTDIPHYNKINTRLEGTYQIRLPERVFIASAIYLGSDTTLIQFPAAQYLCS